MDGQFLYFIHNVVSDRALKSSLEPFGHYFLLLCCPIHPELIFHCHLVNLKKWDVDETYSIRC